MNDKNTNVHLSVAGSTAAEVVTQLLGLAKVMGSDPITSAKTEDLLAELRDRLAKNGQVVKVVPFADEENSTTTAPATRTRAKRTPAADKQPETATATETAAETAKPETATTTTETAATGATKDVNGAAGETTDTATAATLDDVKSALNSFSAVKGQVAARAIMQEKGGAMRLMDIPADKFPALIAALAVPAQSQTAH